MEEYTNINFGKYRGTPINEVPMDYLTWIFPKLSFKKVHTKLYREILRYFLTRDVRVEFSGHGHGYKFFFNDYSMPKVGGGERPFMQSWWKMKNSKGEDVYEVGNQKYPTFIVSSDTGLTITENIKSHTYRFGGLTMVYEINPDYYFFDGYGRIVKHAYLMRKPWIPDGQLAGDFSKNLLMKNLKEKNNY